jgi:predicted small lipoprotein YifL
MQKEYAMSIAYRIAAIGILLVLAGCGSDPHYYPPQEQTTTTYTPPPSSAYPQPYGQPGENFLVVGDQPPSGPMVRNVQVGSYCAQVTDTWVPSVDPTSGTRIWLKQVSRVAIACQ